MSRWTDRQLLGRLGVLLTVPMVMAAGPVIGSCVGGALDRRWQTAPWWLLICAAIGGVGSWIQVYRILQWVARFDRGKAGKP